MMATPVPSYTGTLLLVACQLLPAASLAAPSLPSAYDIRYLPPEYEAQQNNCSAAAAHRLIGERYSQTMEDAAKELSSANSVRVIWPGRHARDLSIAAGRLTMVLDAQERISELICD